MIQPDGATGTAISLVRRGDRRALDAALAEGWRLHDAALLEIGQVLLGAHGDLTHD